MARTANRKRRTDGNYSRQITIGRKPDGKPIRKTIYAKTIKELDAKVAEFERNMRQGTLSVNEKMTFGEMAEIWLRDYKPTISVNTRRMYTTILTKHLLPALGSYKLKDLKPYHMQTIMAEMSEGMYSSKTMKEIKNVAAQILEIAMENDIVFRNVFKKISVPQIEKVERRALTQYERELITKTHAEHKMGLPALLMLYCGLRRGELLALTWGDISLKKLMITVNKAVYFDANTPYVKAPKSKAGIREVPIPEILLPILNGRRAASMMVCPSDSGEMMTQSAIKRAWESYQHFLNIKAGGHVASRSRAKLQVIDHITPHMLRHTYATMLYEAGVDIKSAQKFMGHADIETTLRIYTHLSEQKENASIEALNTHLNSAISLQ